MTAKWLGMTEDQRTGFFASAGVVLLGDLLGEMLDPKGALAVRAGLGITMPVLVICLVWLGLFLYNKKNEAENKLEEATFGDIKLNEISHDQLTLNVVPPPDDTFVEEDSFASEPTSPSPPSTPRSSEALKQGESQAHPLDLKTKCLMATDAVLFITLLGEMFDTQGSLLMRGGAGMIMPIILIAALWAFYWYNKEDPSDGASPSQVLSIQYPSDLSHNDPFGSCSPSPRSRAGSDDGSPKSPVGSSFMTV